jgi:tRNA1Val (adenine37-N6)-methyltransferase
LLQPARGYRFNVDALLLADFANAHARRSVVDVCDLGAGCGVVGLLVLRERAHARLTAVEIQPRLATLARRNLEANDFASRGEVLEVDASGRRLPGARFDLVVSNPPYQALGRGAANPDGEAAIARHELRLTLASLAATLRRILRPRGQAALVYPAARLVELCAALESVGVSPRRVRTVQARADEDASRALILAEKGAATGQLVIEPPLIEHAGTAPTAELARICGR